MHVVSVLVILRSTWNDSSVVTPSAHRDDDGDDDDDDCVQPFFWRTERLKGVPMWTPDPVYLHVLCRELPTRRQGSVRTFFSLPANWKVFACHTLIH